MIVFFFASAAASSAYLTASEIFPLESRALAIATFYALGTLIGGGGLAAAVRPADRGGLALAAGGWLWFRRRVDAGWRQVLSWRWGVAAEGKSLESVAQPASPQPDELSSPAVPP